VLNVGAERSRHSGEFGTITSALDPRVAQFAVKLLF
jgi:hypothetical protein